METRRRAHSDKELINQYIGVLQTLDEFCAPVALLPARQTVIATAILAEATKKSPAYEREALKIYFVWLAAFIPDLTYQRVFAKSDTSDNNIAAEREQTLAYIEEHKERFFQWFAKCVL
jgi:hypothetical protein